MKAAKKILFSTIFFCSCIASFANHITGGEMYYTYKGRSGNKLCLPGYFKIVQRL
jgi:hypothetical protein